MKSEGIGIGGYSGKKRFCMLESGGKKARDKKKAGLAAGLEFLPKQPGISLLR
jgi:hypothetical protein